MVFDANYAYLQTLRSSFRVAVAPLQYAVDYPIRVVGWFKLMICSKKALVDKNIELTYRQTLLESKLQKLKVIRHENAQLKELLRTPRTANHKTMGAQILAVETTPSRQLFILNKGTRDGVYNGQPVLDAKGVVGQVIDAGLLTTTVLMISDAQSAVPVLNNRTGERAILTGTNQITQLSLTHLPKSSDISEGDILVTSGLGRKYPEGYPVGRVEKVRNIPGELFIQVDVAPLAQLNRERLVLLLWPEKNHAAITKQIKKRLSTIDGLESKLRRKG